MNYFEFYLYVISVVIMIATPGPVMILVASAGLKGGYRKALETILGTNLASLILIALSISILKGMFSVNENLFLIIKILGCAYIAYLGFEILKEVRHSKEQSIETLKPIDGGLQKGFLVTAVPQFFTRGSSFELPLVLWVFYRVKIKLLKFFFQTNSLELF